MNVSMNNCRIMSLSNVVLINVLRLCFDIKVSSRPCKKRDLNRDVDKYEFRLNDVSSMNEDESLNDEKFFEIINRKTCR